MPNFKLVNSSSEIKLSNKWAPATKFNSLDRLVNEKGHKIDSDYKGRRFRIIEKRERSFSGLERFGRGFLGTLAVVCTLCLALFSKSVRDLFTNSKKNIRFGIGFQPPMSSFKKIHTPSPVANEVERGSNKPFSLEPLETPSLLPLANEVEQGSNKPLFSAPLKTPSVSVEYETEFKIYLEKCKEGVVINSQELDDVLEGLRKCIEELFERGYDGFKDGKPGRYYSGIVCHGMFVISATNKENWHIKFTFAEGQYARCFNPEEEETALDIVRAYLSSRFREKIQGIKIDDKKMHVTWKN